MSYRVFARKYRPQTFSELVGQHSIVQTLENAIKSNRLAQAYLFVGPRGVGKTSTARILAKALNCIEGPTTTPCGKCDACLEIAEGRSLDVLEIDGASNNSVESIRTLRENAAFSPVRGPYKIYLIDEVHMLTTAAFNALLKTLEEPPSHLKFLFATTEVHKVPATIMSRCQRFDLHRISEKEIAEHLLSIAKKENILLSQEASLLLAKAADGALRDAESMLDQVVSFCGYSIQGNHVQEVFGFTSQEELSLLVQHLFQQDLKSAFLLLKKLIDSGKDLLRFFNDFIFLLRDLLVAKATGEEHPLFSFKEVKSTSSEKLLILLEELGTLENRLRWSNNKELQLEIAFIKTVHLLKESTLSDVLTLLHDIQEKETSSLSASNSPEKRKVSSLEEGTSCSLIAENTPKKEPTSQREKPLSSPLITAKNEEKIDSQKEVEKEEFFHNSSSLKEIISSTEPIVNKEDIIDSSPILEKTPVIENPWNEVVSILVQESRLKFGWVKTGTFLKKEGNQVFIDFPSSYKIQTETLFWPQARKKIQELLSQKFDTPIELVPLFNAQEMNEEQESHEESTTTSPPSSLESGDSPLIEAQRAPLSQEEFKNDPLIQKALEIFKAEIIK